VTVSSRLRYRATTVAGIYQVCEITQAGPGGLSNG